MHGYARSVLETIGSELKKEMYLLFSQFESFKIGERSVKKKIDRLNSIIESQEKIIIDLTANSKWEVQAHENFTLTLQKKGLAPSDILRSGTE